MSSSPRIAVFTTNPKGIYSGGRYLSMMLAHALGMAGAEVTYITNNLPIFDTDFNEFQERAPIRKLVDPKFGLDGLRPADWVVVIPTGSFDDRFYDAARAAARTWHARIALLSFETPNWFSAVSPFPRSPLPSESWRQAISEGGLVVTMAQEGIGFARSYFGEDRPTAPLRFTHWHPPINDLAADKASRPEDPPRRILAFVRTEDLHKGAADLLRLPPETFENHTLSLIFGRGENPDYVAALRRHFGNVPGFAIESYSQISDVEKFALLAKSRLLLFPSYFEGYGYPPVEAAWMGVPTVAYDLPVLRETVGDAATYVRPGDVAGFAAAIRQSLANEPPGPHIRTRMNVVPDVRTAGEKLLNSLISATSAVSPLAGTSKPVPVPANRPALADPMLSGLVAAYGSDQLQIHGIKAETDGLTLRITGQAHGATSNARLRFRMSGASIPDIRFTDMPHGTQSFETVGRILAWRAPSTEETCNIQWFKRNDPVVPIGRVAVRAGPEIYMNAELVLRHMRSHAARVGAEAVLVAEAESLMSDATLSLAVAALCDRLASHQVRSRLCLIGPHRHDRDELELDLAPLADHVEMTDRDGAAASLQACLNAGGVGLSALTPEDLSLDPPQVPVSRIAYGPSSDALHVFGPPKSGAPGEVVISDLHLARRSVLNRREKVTIVLGGEVPLESLPEEVLDILGRIETGAGTLQVVLPRRLCAFETAGAVPFGLAGWIEILDETRLSGICLASMRVAGLTMGADPFTSDFVAQVGAGPTVTWTSEADAASLVAALSEALAPPASARATELDQLLDLVLTETDESAMPVQSRVWSTTFAAHTPKASTPQVALGPSEVLSFSTPDVGHHAALIAGWAHATTEGTWMSGALSTLGFDWHPGAANDDTYQLEILIRTRDAAANGCTLAINLNGVELGRVTQQNKPGVQKHVLAVPVGLLCEDRPQYLLLARLPAKPVDDMIRDLALVSLSIAPPLMDGHEWGDFVPDAAALAPLFHPHALGQYLPRIIGHAAADVPEGLALWRGWSVAEPDGVWSDGRTAIVGITGLLVPGPAATLCLSATAFGSTPEIMQRIRLLQADRQVAEFCLPGTRSTIAIALPQDLEIEEGSYFALTFPDAVTPFDLLGTADHRKLGLLLTSATLQISAGTPHEVEAVAGAETALLARTFPVTPGVLLVQGRGNVTRVQVSGDAVFVTPSYPEGRSEDSSGPDAITWLAALRLNAEQIATGHVVINALMAGADEDPVIDAITFWPDVASDVEEDEPARIDVTLSLRRDSLPDDLRPWLNHNRVHHDALIRARPLPLPFRARIADLELGGLGLEAGWSTPEDDFIWSVGDRATLCLPADLPDADILLCLDTMAFLSGDLELQRQSLICMDQPLATLYARDSLHHSRWFALPRGLAPARRLHFALPDATSPQALGLSQDGRSLSMAFLGLRLTSIVSADAALNLDHAPSGWALHLSRTDQGIGVLEISGHAAPPSGLALAGDNTVLHPVSTPQGWRVLFVLPDDVPEELVILQVASGTEAELTPENHPIGAKLRLADFEGAGA